MHNLILRAALVTQCMMLSHTARVKGDTEAVDDAARRNARRVPDVRFWSHYKYDTVVDFIIYLVSKYRVVVF